MSPAGRRTFLTGIKGELGCDQIKSEKLARNLDKISRFHNQLNLALDQYTSSLVRKVDKEDEDYLLAYRAEMLKIQKKLDTVRDNSDKMKSALQSEDYIRTLERSLAWFKEEAQRLSQSTEDQRKDIAFWKERIKIYEGDIKDLNKELRDVNGQIKSLEAATGDTAEDLLAFRPQTVSKPVNLHGGRTNAVTSAAPIKKRSKTMPKICHVIQYMLINNERKDRIIEETMRYHNTQICKNDEMVRTLEQSIQNVATQEMNPEINRKIRHTPFLEAFLDSVEKVRSQISRRVSRYNKEPAKKSRAISAIAHGKKKMFAAAAEEVENQVQVKLGNFTATDKKAVFIQFMNSPEVYEKIKQIIGTEMEKEISKNSVQLNTAQCIFAEKGAGNVSVGAKSNNITYTSNMAAGASELIESEEKSNKFQASHLYSAPRIPTGFAAETKRKRKKLASRSFHGVKHRPGTVIPTAANVMMNNSNNNCETGSKNVSFYLGVKNES